jgi:pyruvate/2-oxoglutarate dehydrogenase complex dihydrolipoamide acyltransferase (E2) component
MAALPFSGPQVTVIVSDMNDIERRPFPANRQWVLGAMRVGHRVSPMTALTQVDVTDAWRSCKDLDISPTAFIIACVGRAVAAHPEVHAYRDWLGRLVIHRRVNIATMVEVPTPSGLFPLAHLIEATESRTVKDISHELRSVAEVPEVGRSGRLMARWGSLAGRIPGLVTLVYRLAKRSSGMRRGIGTVSVSSVGMIMGGNGFAMGVPTLASISVVIGGATERPWVVDTEVAVRRILDISVQVDHRVVDGAPAARCGAYLRQLLEHPELIEW